MQLVKVVAVCLALAACTTTAPSMDGDDSGDDDGKADGFGTSDSRWLGVGLGVEYQQVNTGNAILIAYGGYTAKLAYSAAWSEELVDARLGEAGFGRIYAVQGPKDASYAAREIGNSKLRKHLLTIDDGTSPIIIVAHSSGTFVAHELLEQLDANGNTEILSRISYANLDGGGSGLDEDIAGELGKLEFVYAHDPAAGYSENNATAKALASEYAPKAKAFEVEVTGTGCHSGAGWCMHDALITHKPHNHDTYDLADDYVDFANRAPTIEYLEPFIPST